VYDRRALTILEILVVIAVLLLIASASFVVMREASLGRDARAIGRLLTLNRSTALLAGTPSSCLREGRFGPLVRSSPVRGLLFTPDGLPRTCDGGGVGNTSILLEHRGRQAAVIVSSLGRVRWELR